MCPVNTKFNHKIGCVSEYIFFLYWPYNSFFKKSRYLSRSPLSLFYYLFIYFSRPLDPYGATSPQRQLIAVFYHDIVPQPSIICNANSCCVITAVCAAIANKKRFTCAISRPAICIQYTSFVTVQTLIPQDANFHGHCSFNVRSMNAKHF